MKSSRKLKDITKRYKANTDFFGGKKECDAFAKIITYQCVHYSHYQLKYSCPLMLSDVVMLSEFLKSMC